MDRVNVIGSRDLREWLATGTYGDIGETKKGSRKVLPTLRMKVNTLMKMGHTIRRFLAKKGKDSVKTTAKGRKPKSSDGRIPCIENNFTTKNVSNLYTIKKSNQYLKIMHIKLKKYSKEEDGEKFSILADLLIGRSRSYGIMCLFRAEPGGYLRKNHQSIMNSLKGAIRKARSKSCESLKVYRTYIPKKNGKFRPIGAPNTMTKTLLTMIERITTCAVMYRIGNYQHGFLPNRSTATATRELINGIKMKGLKEVVEFDLKSCFNMINTYNASDLINVLVPGLGRGIFDISNNCSIEFNEYQEENEIIKLDTQIFGKRGFTQGSPISPIMSIFAMEYSRLGSTPNLIMYADDGVILETGAQVDKILDNETTRQIGVRLADDKPFGRTDRFTFLGITYDLTHGNIGAPYPGMGQTLQKHYYIKDLTSKEIDEICLLSNYGSHEPGPLGIWEPQEGSELYNYLSPLKRSGLIMPNLIMKGLRQLDVRSYLIQTLYVEILGISSEFSTICAGVMFEKLRDADSIKTPVVLMEDRRDMAEVDDQYGYIINDSNHRLLYFPNTWEDYYYDFLSERHDEIVEQLIRNASTHRGTRKSAT